MVNALVISFTHKNTDIELREKLSLDDTQKLALLKALREHPRVLEALVLSTCNRVEIYMIIAPPASEDIPLPRDIVDDVLASLIKIAALPFAPRPALYFRMDALSHIFSVASSLDSLVIGETQIAHQLKLAFKYAYANDFSQEMMAKIINNAFRCAAAIRNKTSISNAALSVASVAVDVAKTHSKTNTAVVVGAGEMGLLCIKHLSGSYHDIIVLVRDVERACGAIAAFATTPLIRDATLVQDMQHKDSNIRVRHIEDLKSMVNEHSLIFTTTSAKEPLITDAMIEERPFRRIFVDIGIPRNIELQNRGNIILFSVDDLQRFVDLNLRHKETQVVIAKEIIANAIARFDSIGLGETQARALHISARDAYIKVLNNAIKKGYIDKSDAPNIERLMASAFNGFLHNATAKLRSDESAIEAYGALFN